MSTTQQQVVLLVIDQNNELQRIDNFLLSKLKGVPKSKIYKILRKGEVRVNKKRVKPDYKLQCGDSVRIPPIKLEQVPQASVSQSFKDKVESSIIYEDERLLVVNKPSGLAVHGGSGINLGLIEVLRSARGEDAYLELVHRIDRDTSGCLLIAKKRSALRHLHAQLRENRMHKTYHAIVKAAWPKNLRMSDAPLYKNTLQGGERIVVVDHELGKLSKTKFSLLYAHPEFSLIEARPISGRTHQIRVHCASEGYPIANDDKYGDKAFDKGIKALGCNRLCLHAKTLKFFHPLNDEMIEVEAEYDEQMQNIVRLCQ